MNIAELSFFNRIKTQKQTILPHCPVFKLQKDKMEWLFTSQNLITLKKKFQNTSLINFCEIQTQKVQVTSSKQNQNGQILIIKSNKNYLQEKLRHIVNHHLKYLEEKRPKENSHELLKCQTCDSYQTDYHTVSLNISLFKKLINEEINKINKKSLTIKQSFQVVSTIFNAKLKQKSNQLFWEGVNNETLQLDSTFHLIKLKQKCVRNYQKNRISKQKNKRQTNPIKETLLTNVQQDFKQRRKTIICKDEIVQVQWTNNYLLLNHKDVKMINKSDKNNKNNPRVKCENRNISEHMKLKLSQKCQQLQTQIQQSIQDKLKQINKNKNSKCNEKVTQSQLKEIKENLQINTNNKLRQQHKMQDQMKLNQIKIQSFRLWGFINNQNMQIYTIFISQINFKLQQHSFRLYSNAQIYLNQIQITQQIHANLQTYDLNQQEKGKIIQKQRENSIKLKQLNKQILSSHNKQSLPYHYQDINIFQCICCKVLIENQSQVRKIVNKNIPKIQLFKKIKMTKLNDLESLYQMVDICQDCYSIFLTNIYQKSQLKIKHNQKQKAALLLKITQKVKFQQIQKNSLKSESYIEQFAASHLANIQKIYKKKSLNHKKQNTKALNKEQSLQQKAINADKIMYQCESEHQLKKNYLQQQVSKEKNFNYIKGNIKVKSKTFYQNSNISTIGTSFAHSSKGKHTQIKQQSNVLQKSKNQLKQSQANEFSLKQRVPIKVSFRQKYDLNKILNKKFVKIGQNGGYLKNKTIDEHKKQRETIKTQLHIQTKDQEKSQNQSNKIEDFSFKQIILDQINYYTKNNKKAKQRKCSFTQKSHRIKQQGSDFESNKNIN